MKKGLLVKLIVMALVLVSVLTLASCFDGTPGNLDDINKDIADRKDSEGLVFKEGKDGDGNKYYSVTGLGECTDKIVVIPEEYNGAPVTKILNKAFSGTDIERVVIPESVTNIAHHAFANCEQLKQVKIPDSVDSLGSDAFSGCISLTDLYIGKSLKEISKAAFEGCTALTGI